MIDANAKELRHAFSQNKDLAVTGSSPTHYLLLFYAVECGLKSIYLKRQPHFVHTIEDIEDKDLQRSHDLKKWVEKLHLSPKVTTQLSFRLTRNAKNNSSSTHSLSEAHQVWRYGIKMNSDDEKKLVEWLEKIKQWIEENI